VAISHVLLFSLLAAVIQFFPSHSFEALSNCKFLLASFR
jgi:hypothetical protein